MCVNIKSDVTNISSVEDVCLMCGYFNMELSEDEMLICPKHSPIIISAKRCNEIKYFDNNVKIILDK